MNLLLGIYFQMSFKIIEIVLGVTEDDCMPSLKTYHDKNHMLFCM